MSNTIKDGAGKGNYAKVDEKLRLRTSADVFLSDEVALINSAGYTISIGNLELTTDTESGVVYLKNLNDSAIVITNVVIIAGDSTGAPDKAIDLVTYINPTGGTVISDATPAPIINRDLSSSNLPDVTAYVGAQGKTITGGTRLLGLIHSDRSLSDNYPSFIVPKGFSAGFAIIPATGNTAIKLALNINFYIKDEL